MRGDWSILADDDGEQVKAKATATTITKADPYGMTTKRTSNCNGNGNGNPTTDVYWEDLRRTVIKNRSAREKSETASPMVWSKVWA